MKKIVSAAVAATLVASSISGVQAATKQAYQADASKVPGNIALGCYIVLTTMAQRSMFDKYNEEARPLANAYEAQVNAAIKASGQAGTAADVSHPAVNAMMQAPEADLRKEYDRCWTTADAHMVKFRARTEYKNMMTCWAVRKVAAPDDPMVYFLQHDVGFAMSDAGVSVDVREKAMDRAVAEVTEAMAKPEGAQIKANYANCDKSPDWAALRLQVFAPVSYGATIKEKYPDYDLKVGNLRAQENDHFPREKVSKEILDRLTASGWKFPGYNDPITGEALVASNVWEITPGTFGKWTTMPELAPATICAAAYPFRGPADKVPPGSLTYWDIAQEQLQKGGFDFHDATVIIGVLGTYQSIATHWDAKEPCKRWGEAVAKTAGKTLFIPDPPGLQ